MKLEYTLKRFIDNTITCLNLSVILYYFNFKCSHKYNCTKQHKHLSPVN